jgi:hypothetical protein
MARITNLTPENEEQLRVAEQYTDRLVAERDRAAFTEREISQAQTAVKNLLARFGPLDQSGNFTDSIDGQITRRIQDKAETVKADIQAAMRSGRPTPLDYYEIYTKVLQDSGLTSNTLVDPDTMRQLDSRIRAAASDAQIDARSIFVLGGPCDVCNLCNACGGCGFCALCAPTGVGVIGALGLSGTTGLAGTAGAFQAGGLLE